MNVKKILIILLCVILLTGFNVYNALVINPAQLTIREETLNSEKIDTSLDGLLIAWFSDLDYKGSEEDKAKLDLLSDTINGANPDLVLFGGDLLYECEDSDYVREKLTSLKARIGKFAVLGEEDSTSTVEILQDAGFTILDDMSCEIYAKNGSAFNLAGLSLNGDNTAATSGLFDAYTLVISHYPDNASNISNADYILAGHSLGGRVYFPIISSFENGEGATRYYQGKHSVNGATLDITNGVSTKEKSTRFMADAEVVFYKLESN